ncbi:hypothetical protein LEMLEM_LOCUS10062, partial [Lemmus lemmus]
RHGRDRQAAKGSEVKLKPHHRSARVVVDGGASLPLLNEVGVRSRRTVWKRSRGSHCILLRNWRRSRRSSRHGSMVPEKQVMQARRDGWSSGMELQVWQGATVSRIWKTIFVP